MSRLIVVSNRVSVPKARGAAGAQGGLAVALGSALRERRGIWFGWSGEETPHFTGDLDMQRNQGVTTATIDLEHQDVEEYYNGYANRTLWPLFHYRIDLAEFERDFGKGYERVNQRFADSLYPLLESDDVIWVHDYHLLPLGERLRARGAKNRIGFFLHIPWPPTRLFVSLPYHDRLVRSMLSYDLVGFQTEEAVESFLHYCARELGADVDDAGTVRFEGRTTRVRSFPIGLDYDEFCEAGNSGEARNAQQRVLSSSRGRKVMIGVDRLDYSKGLPERFDSISRFFDAYPERVAETLYIQIAPPSRQDVSSYQRIREVLEGKAGQINGARSEVDMVPIRYVNRGYPRNALFGFYRAARIGLVTPLRDGMNLVAKEYIAAQHPEDPGVLILSRFAGAADQLGEALLVNPHSAEEVSEAIRVAQDMPLDERKERWQALRETVSSQNVVNWRRDFVNALAGD
ncbi:alpha,alpha-trehalose-phosphate synthase (UDP-forming) [Pacificimonas flava]|uniref:Alpha,alpha-trehalose-phosphate synthase n=1 Tax=Pacificimonas flava TaxID=1234595 RepID=M2U737_9SPHN|nr:trehalose-6-phosphate synthase [Pacificimonas flava]EMD83822.1 Alpha,alpha-trehalose-phosphate synthase [Pacificimonas flava]MBB5280496.1 trehalose 6-phosphate synthase [Pacificimonas flava]